MNFLSTKCSLNNTYQAICLWIVESWEICDSLVPTQKALDTKLRCRRPLAEYFSPRLLIVFQPVDVITVHFFCLPKNNNLISFQFIVR